MRVIGAAVDGNGADPREIVERVWESVAADAAVGATVRIGGLPPYEAMVEDHDRRYLNAHAVLARPAHLLAEGRADLRQRLKGRVVNLLTASLERFFDDEQEFRLHLVRLVNSLTVQQDRLSEEVRLLRDETQRAADALGRADQVRQARLEARLAVLERRLDQLAAGGRTVP